MGQDINCLFIWVLSGASYRLPCALCGGADLLALAPKDTIAWRWFFHMWQNLICVLPCFSRTNSHYNLLQAALQGSEALVGMCDPPSLSSACQPQCHPCHPDSKTCPNTNPIKKQLNWRDQGEVYPPSLRFVFCFLWRRLASQNTWVVRKFDLRVSESPNQKMFYFLPKKHCSFWESCAWGQPAPFQPLVVLSSPAVGLLPNGKIAASWGWGLVSVWKTVILWRSEKNKFHVSVHALGLPFS